MIKKTYLALAAIVALVYGKIEPLEERKVESLAGKPPGIIVRVKQHSMDEMIHALQYFLPEWLESDFDLKGKTQTYTSSFFFGLFRPTLSLTDFSYDQPNLDLTHTKIRFSEAFGKAMLKIYFPALKSWKISFNSQLRPLEWAKNKMVLDFEDLNLDANLKLQTDSKGYLRPRFLANHFKWGNTRVYHENLLTSLFLDPFVRYMMVIIQNAMYIGGDVILNNMIENPLNEILNYYQFPFTFKQSYFFPGQSGSDDFQLDLRNIPGIDPQVASNQIDFYLSGQMLYKGKTCQNEITDDRLHFYNSQSSQIVIGASTATCWIRHMLQSNLNMLRINERSFNEMFKLDGSYNLNTSSMKPYIKLFEQKLGKNKKLKFDVWFHESDLTFGKYDADIIADYQICFSMRLDNYGSNEVPPLMTDCLQMQTSMLASTNNDVWHIDLLENKLNLDVKGANRDSPKQNSMSLTTNEYREFLEDFSFTCQEFMNWMNAVILRGNRVKFPFHPDQLMTTVKFEDQKMHIMIEPEDMLYKYMEDNFV